jgi:PAS domain S-box-containing protein
MQLRGITGISLKVKVALLVSALLVFFSTVRSSVALFYLEGHFKDAVSSQQSSLVAAMASELDDQFSTARELLAASARAVPAGALTDTAEAQRFLDGQTGLRVLFNGGISLISQNGKVLAATSHTAAPEETDVSQLPFYRTTITTAKPYISVSEAGEPGQPAISMTAPLLGPTGLPTGVLEARIDARHGSFLSELSRVRVGRTGYLWLVTENRMVMVHPDNTKLQKAATGGTDRLLDRALRGFDGTGEITAPDGSAVLASYKHLQTAPLIVAGYYPVTEAYEPVETGKVYILWAALLGLAVIPCLVWLLMKRLMAPLDAATLHVRRLPQKSGDDRFLPNASSRDEIGSLSAAFNAMIHALDGQQQALRESEARLRTVVTNTPVALFALDRNGVFTMSEGKGLATLGLEPGEVDGQSVFALCAPWPDLLAGARRALAGESFNLSAEAGGAEFEIWCCPAFGESGELTGTIGIATDVSARRKAEQEHRKLVRLVEMSRDFIGLATTEGLVSYLNPAGLEMVGLESLDEARTKSVFDFVPDSDLPLVREVIPHKLLAEGLCRLETRLRHFRTGKIIEVEMTAFVIKSSGGGQTWLATVTRDISERKRAEEARAKLEEQLLQAQKLESIGRLAGGVAHDFNNLLTVILGYSRLVLEELKEGDVFRSEAEAIREAGERAAELTSQLLAFSRKQLTHPQPIDLNTIVSDAAKMLSRLVGDDIELVATLDPSLGHVMADPTQMHQCLMNLAANARDAMPQGGRLIIKTQNVELDEGYAASHPEISAGPYILLAVSDTGMGMDDETRKNIFEPFFTTKRKGHGTGLGLSMVYGIIRQSRGSIFPYSELGKGTTFKIYLPRVDAKPKVDAPAASESKTLRGSETVLIVEDQAEVRALAGMILRSRGYRVVEAPDGRQALSLTASYPEPIHLLLTDVVMPGMNGRELAERISVVRPGIKVLYTSGYDQDVIAHRGVLRPGVAYIPKPYTPDGLAAKVREVLEGA